MPSITDYSQVLARLRADGLICNYPNGGSFGLPGQVQPLIRGWIGPDDPTIRPNMLPFTQRVPNPYESNLARRAVEFWTGSFSSPAWLMPAAHWAFELDHGHGPWLDPLLVELGIHPSSLTGRNNAAAIEFLAGEHARFETAIVRLLENLSASDFTIAFPGHPIVCMIHHHKQLWWMTADPVLYDRICLPNVHR